MPVHQLTTSWSAPIALLAGDIIQNHSSWAIETVAVDPDADPARLRLPAHIGAYQVTGAKTIRARCILGSAALHVVRGF